MRTPQTDCPRCHGEALPHYKHVAGGKCFKCGRALAGEAQAAPAGTGWTRGAIISALDVRIRKARAPEFYGYESAAEFLSDLEDPERGITLTQLLAIAPADVRARAEAALAPLRA